MDGLRRPPGKRNKIVVERRCFPSDEYAVQSVVQQHGLNPEEAILYIDRRSGEEQWRTEDIVKFIEEHVRTVLYICIQVSVGIPPAFSSPTENVSVPVHQWAPF